MPVYPPPHAKAPERKEAGRGRAALSAGPGLFTSELGKHALPTWCCQLLLKTRKHCPSPRLKDSVRTRLGPGVILSQDGETETQLVLPGSHSTAQPSPHVAPAWLPQLLGLSQKLHLSGRGCLQLPEALLNLFSTATLQTKPRDQG